MRALYRVIKEHKAGFPDAMIAMIGDRVKIGREDTEMPGWYWCSDKNEIDAWVPEPYIDMKDGDAVFNQPYNSIEHSVVLGEIVQYLGEVFEWTECLNKEWKYGWIPSEKLKKI